MVGFLKELWCVLMHRRYRRARVVGLFDCECACEKCDRAWIVN